MAACRCRWLDAHTRRLVEETLNLTGELTFTVRCRPAGIPSHTRRPLLLTLSTNSEHVAPVQDLLMCGVRLDGWLQQGHGLGSCPIVCRTPKLSGLLQVRPGAPVRLTREQVAHLPMQEFTALWMVRLPRDPLMLLHVHMHFNFSVCNVFGLLTHDQVVKQCSLRCRSTSMRMRTAWCGPMAMQSRRTASGWCAGLKTYSPAMLNSQSPHVSLTTRSQLRMYSLE